MTQRCPMQKNLIIRLPKTVLVTRRGQIPVQAIAKAMPQPRAMPIVPMKTTKVVVVGRAQPHLSLRKAPKSKGPRIMTRDVSALSIEKIKALRGCATGKYLVITGNGPSLSEVDLRPLKTHPRVEIMSVNKPDSRIWPTTSWLFSDTSQYKRNLSTWEDYKGMIFNSTSIPQKKNSIQMKNLAEIGFSADLTVGCHIGRSSVYAAMQVALWMGYRKIFLFGVDMCAVGGKLHFYGANPDVTAENRQKRFALEAEYYEYAGKTLPSSDRSRYYFCSSYNQWPFVEMYNRLDHKTAVAEILTLLET